MRKCDAIEAKKKKLRIRKIKAKKQKANLQETERKRMNFSHYFDFFVFDKIQRQSELRQ